MPPKKRTISTSSEDSEKVNDSLFTGMIITPIGSSFASGTQTELIAKITASGGTCSKTYASRVTHVVTTQADYNKMGSTLQKAIAAGIPILSEDFILKSIEKSTKQNEKDFTLAAVTAEESSSEEEAEVKTTTTTTRAKRATRATVKEDVESEDEAPDEAKSSKAKKTKTKTSEESAPKRSEEMEKRLAEVDSDLDDSSDDDSSTKTKVQIKGRAAVDVNCSLKNNYHVYDDGKDVYDATLNQTEIKNNNNKFYIIQLLESDSGGEYYVWNRWGREGLVGQSKLEKIGSLNTAITTFCKKFYDKTRNTFHQRANFKKIAGQYDLLEIDYSVKEDKPKAEKKKVEHKGESTLDARVQNFIKLIFDLKMMKKTMIEAEYDLKKMPLGKLSKNQILKGYEVLKEIDDKIKNPSMRGDDLTTLSSRFYTLIPHCFGMRVPPVINSLMMVKSKIDMLQNLADIEIAANLIKESDNDESNIVDAHYKQLKCDIQPIEVGSEEYEQIATYVKNTYSGKTPKIISLFRIDRDGERSRFDTKKSLGNRKLLWHGSRLTNFVGIISQGLRIAPPEAPVSGYRFGKGIYFADIMSLSAAYCRTSGTDDFCMFLGDVALGKTADLYRDTYMEKPMADSNSTLALGVIEPDPTQAVKHSDGYEIPSGGIVNSPYKNTSCKEHQYVVYDVSQVNLKYLLQLKY